MNEWLFVLLGYLSGSVFYARILTGVFTGKDICAVSEDGNPGVANAFVYGTPWIGCMALVMELLKGMLPVYMAAKFVDVQNPLFGAVLLAPVLGHAFPLWKKEQGGKSIAVSFGVLMGLFPDVRALIILIVCYLFFSLVLVIKPHLHRSILTFLCFEILCIWKMQNRFLIPGCVALGAIVVYKHARAYHGETLQVYIANRYRIL